MTRGQLSLDWVKGDETVFRLPDGDEEEAGEKEQEDCQAGGAQEEHQHPGVEGEEGAACRMRMYCQDSREQII